jgi:uncharacterized protein (DUF2126 family)
MNPQNDKDSAVQHVATALPQTKELPNKKIGERFLEYLQDKGLKHAAFQNESGQVKIVGLNKDQVKEAIQDMLNKSAKVKEVGLPAGTGLNMDNGSINGAPDEKDLERIKSAIKEVLRSIK